MRAVLSAFLMVVSAQAQAAEKYAKEMDALNLCMYTAGIRLFGVGPADMLKLILSACDGKIHALADATSNKPKIDPNAPISLSTEEGAKAYQREQANAHNTPMAKFAIDYFISDYTKALNR